MAAEDGRADAMSGVILAGGGNRRMGGRMKALLSLNGELFIDRQLKEMSKVCSEIIIVANEPLLFARQLEWPLAKVRVIPDLQPGNGPLAGLQAAMTEARHDELWVAACDMPFISAQAAGVLLEFLRRQAPGGAACDAAVAELKGKLQPLHGIYRRRCLGKVNELLDGSRYRMMELLDELNTVTVQDSVFIDRGIQLRFAENVNTPEDLERIQR